MALTVAIPTMERWSFLKDQIPKYLNDPNVSYLVISDENGKDINIICELEMDSNPKLRLYQNDTVLGVYGNKRQCLLKAPSEWVAVLDSDNKFGSDFFDAFLKAKERDGPKADKTIYCAGFIQHLNLETGSIENKTNQFNGMKISRDNWNSVLKMPGWNFLLNDGNCIWPREVIKHFPDLPEDQIVGTDSIFFMRQAIQAGYTLSVEPTMHYIHTVHDGSHWLQNAAVSSRLMGLRDWRV
uniref:Glycosyltransferase 2-like domain-containing protein n=1 Tax=viral metagenome TaxID=1070528 RepID=A0A6C0DKJ9_9ZZZZ